MPFKKGVVTNPNGRPRGSKNAVTVKIFEDLLKEMKIVEKDEKISKGKSVLRHFIERAYKNDTVLCAFMKKLVADRTFNIEDFQNGTIRVTFEIVEAKKEKEEKVKKNDNENNLNNNNTSN